MAAGRTANRGLAPQAGPAPGLGGSARRLPPLPFLIDLPLGPNPRLGPESERTSASDCNIADDDSSAKSPSQPGPDFASGRCKCMSRCLPRSPGLNTSGTTVKPHRL
jgi:hypothetical protein